MVCRSFVFLSYLSISSSMEHNVIYFNRIIVTNIHNYLQRDASFYSLQTYFCSIFFFFTGIYEEVWYSTPFYSNLHVKKKKNIQVLYLI